MKRHFITIIIALNANVRQMSGSIFGLSEKLRIILQTGNERLAKNCVRNNTVTYKTRKHEEIDFYDGLRSLLCGSTGTDKREARQFEPVGLCG